MGTKVFFFNGPNYLRYDRGEDRLDEGYPLSISAFWPGLAAAGFTTIDAAVNWGNGSLYIFKGDQYLRYDIANDRMADGYPQSIAAKWPGFAEAGFDQDLDCAVAWGNGKAFFFKGDRYLRYDMAADRTDDGYPLRIADNWPGFAGAGFASDLQSALDWGNGKAYFFKGDRYLRYDIAGDQTDDGYPLPIAGNWPGFSEAGITQDLRGAVDLLWLDPDRMWLPDAQQVRSPVNGPRFNAFPWRGVLHTTEGSTADAAIDSFRGNNFWPHFTIDPKRLRVVQHLPLSIGSRALSDNGIQANHARCIQIEIVGKAAETPGWAPEQLAFIREVMRDIEDKVPIPRTSSRRFLDAAGVNATPGNRMTPAEWKGFSGWCGHQHVPGENHWDPGGIDIDTLLKT